MEDLEGHTNLGDDPTVRDVHRTRRARQSQPACIDPRASVVPRTGCVGRPVACPGALRRKETRTYRSLRDDLSTHDNDSRPLFEKPN